MPPATNAANTAARAARCLKHSPTMSYHPWQAVSDTSQRTSPAKMDCSECFNPAAVGRGREPPRADFFAFESEELRALCDYMGMFRHRWPSLPCKLYYTLLCSGGIRTPNNIRQLYGSIFTTLHYAMLSHARPCYAVLCSMLYAMLCMSE